MQFCDSLISKRPISFHLSIQRWSKYYNAYISKAGTDVVWLLRFFLLLIFIVIIVPALTARGRGTEGNTVVVSYRERATREEGRWALYGIHKVSHLITSSFPQHPLQTLLTQLHVLCSIIQSTFPSQVVSSMQININKLQFY